MNGLKPGYKDNEGPLGPTTKKDDPHLIPEKISTRAQVDGLVLQKTVIYKHSQSIFEACLECFCYHKFCSVSEAKHVFLILKECSRGKSIGLAWLSAKRRNC